MWSGEGGRGTGVYGLSEMCWEVRCNAGAGVRGNAVSCHTPYSKASAEDLWDGQAASETAERTGVNQADRITSNGAGLFAHQASPGLLPAKHKDVTLGPQLPIVYANFNKTKNERLWAPTEGCAVHAPSPLSLGVL